MEVWKKTRLFVVTAVLVAAALAAPYASQKASAEQANSTHYGVDEVQIGAGSARGATSTNYKADATIGDLTVGSTSSPNYKATHGSDTTNIPVLEFLVVGGSNDFGTFSTTATRSGSADIYVRTYQSSGYTMQLTGTPPAQAVHTINALSAPSTSQTGVEQFGINLAANTTPAVGADPVQVPDSSFSYGAPTGNYANHNLFMFQVNDIIAQSVVATGQTHYTLSYIVNVAANTAAGKYTTNMSVVVAARF